MRNLISNEIHIWTDCCHRQKNEFPSLSKFMQENLRPSVHQLKLNRGSVMQQDNDPRHRSKSTTEWLQQKKMKKLWLIYAEIKVISKGSHTFSCNCTCVCFQHLSLCTCLPPVLKDPVFHFVWITFT